VTKTRLCCMVRGLTNAVALPGLLLSGLLAGPGVQTQPPSSVEPQVPFRISISVDLVVMHATVLDREGRPVLHLREPDFTVYEDGVPQSIRFFRHEDASVTVGLVIDHSGSMRPKLDDVVAAARVFVQTSKPDDEMFVVNFNEKVSLGLPGPIRFSNRLDDLNSAILQTPATGQTALYDAVAEALDRVQTGGREKKVLIVMSDGGDTASKLGLPQFLAKAQTSNVLIYAIGIFDKDDPDQNPKLLLRLARSTGGEAYFPYELSETESVCKRIARDIRNQYTIGYVPARAVEPGRFRSIRVAAKADGHRKLVVRTRTGYISGGDSTPVKNQSAK